jgi:PQQ enzyme repeat
VEFATGGEKHYAGTHLHYLQPAMESMPDPWDFYLSSPTVWMGTVYFGSSDGNVYALADSGEPKWKFKTGDVGLVIAAMAGFPAPKSVITSLAGFAARRPQPPGGCTAIPAAFRY